MASSLLGRVGRALRWCWWLLDASRRALLNLLLLIIVVVLLIGWLRGGTPALKDNTALVLALQGPIVEQAHGNPRDAAIQQLRGDGGPQTRLRDVLDVLDAAAKDPKITRAVLVLDDFGGAGLPVLREVAAALERFKASGKQVVAWGSGFDQRSYYLAAHANEVWLHPMGAVLIEGFGRYRNYYKDVFDKIGVTAHVLRVGTYKNAAETFVANGPSKETLESEGLLYDDMWATYTAGVEKARKLPAGAIIKGINELPELLTAAGGNAAKLALDTKLVDALKTRDELRATLIERGVRDDESKSFRQIPYQAYAARLKPATHGDAVGVVVAEGAIVDGRAPGGMIGGLSTAELIRRARDDDSIKAVVLRVDSPGGSAFGSELVRRELELTRKAGKPVVVSMSNVAASGGYWISMASDEVIADEATISGSIGVIAMLPTAEAALDKIGLHTGGYTTTWLAGAYDVRRPLDPRFAKLLQASIENVYTDFTSKAAAARKTTREKIDAVAQGRVWTGRQALERGLVDRLGSYGDALQAAAARGKITGTPRIVYLEREPGRLERLLNMFGGASIAQALGVHFDSPWSALGVPAPVAAQVQSELSWMVDAAGTRKPFAALAHCLCAQP